MAGAPRARGLPHEVRFITIHLLEHKTTDIIRLCTARGMGPRGTGSKEFKMENNNLTTRVIMNEIDGNMYEGDALERLASFLSYCNERTTFGVPRHCCPLDSDMLLEFDALIVHVSDVAIEAGFSNSYCYAIEETDEAHTVRVTSYLYDNEFDELYPDVYDTPTFDVSDPRDLATLCGYIGVTFSPSYFE